nr:MAG TPA: hypothetical protein [Caudoviricetes sp.]
MDIRSVQAIKPHCPAIILLNPLLLLLYSLTASAFYNSRQTLFCIGLPFRKLGSAFENKQNSSF